MFGARNCKIRYVSCEPPRGRQKGCDMKENWRSQEKRPKGNSPAVHSDLIIWDFIPWGLARRPWPSFPLITHSSAIFFYQLLALCTSRYIWPLRPLVFIHVISFPSSRNSGSFLCLESSSLVSCFDSGMLFDIGFNPSPIICLIFYIIIFSHQ